MKQKPNRVVKKITPIVIPIVNIAADMPPIANAIILTKTRINVDNKKHTI